MKQNLDRVNQDDMTFHGDLGSSSK